MEVRASGRGWRAGNALAGLVYTVVKPAGFAQFGVRDARRARRDGELAQRREPAARPWVNALTRTERTITGPVDVPARCTITDGLLTFTGVAVSSVQVVASLSSIRSPRFVLVASPVIVAPFATTPGW